MPGTVLIAAVALPLLLYIPGLLFSRAIAGARSSDALERHYERVVVSALLSGWLALLLASFGVFSLRLQLGLLLLVCAALLVGGRKTLRQAQGRPQAAGRTTGASSSVILRHWELLAFALVGLVALLLVVRPFEVVIGARDAGVYANTGFAIARTGSIVQYDALLAGMGQDALASDTAVRDSAAQALTNFLGVQDRERNIATRLRAAGFLINEGDAAGGRVTPQFLHLFPAWIGLLTSIAGLYGGLFAPGLMGLLGAWSVGMLGRRLAGPWVGLLAFLFLALNGVQIWFARYSTAETTAQFLTFAGLYFFAKFAMADDTRQTIHDGATQATYRLSSVVYGLLCGVAIGQIALTRIDFFLLAPVALYLVYCALTRRWAMGHTALALALGAMLVHAGLHIVFIARAYFFDTGHDRLRDYALVAALVVPLLTPDVQASYRAALLEHPLKLWRELGLALFALLALLVLWRWPQPLHTLERIVQSGRTLLLGSIALGILVLAGYAYLVRPQIIDGDMLFNTRGGWSDPLTRDPRLVQQDVNEWRMAPEVARNQAGVVIVGDVEYAATKVDEAATTRLREELRAARGPWQGPFSNQTFNWLRLQGYVGAPIALPRIVYDETVEWWRVYAENVPDGVTPPPGVPVPAKYSIPLANLVRVGWYLSPLGIVLGVAGFALWWWRGLNRNSWLFLTLALLGAFFWVRQTYGTSDQTYIYILRRYVPIVYPAFSLGMAYALASLGRWTIRFSLPSPVLRLPSIVLTLALLAFFAWTNRPLYRHVEYGGAVRQIEAAAQQFTPERDVLLLRGGAPIYGQARDVPDLLATPLRFAFGIDALTVKSSQPGAYADALAAQVQRWQATGRTVYLALSASGAGFALPGFALEKTGTFTLDVPEFEQLENQKPQNVSALTLPFTVYRLVPATAGTLGTAPAPLTPNDFAAQVVGFYRPETQGVMDAPTANPVPYAWTDGSARLRLAWPSDRPPRQITLRVAGGPRPAHLGPARLCLALQAETSPWPTERSTPTTLGCLTLRNTMESYTIPLDPQRLPPISTGSVLLHLDNDAWVPAVEDPRQNDRRAVGVQFGGLNIDP